MGILFDYHGCPGDRSRSDVGLITQKKCPDASETPRLPLPHAISARKDPRAPAGLSLGGGGDGLAASRARHPRMASPRHDPRPAVLPNGSSGTAPARSSLRPGRAVPGASATESRERVPRSWVELSIYWIGEARGPFTSRPSRCKALNSRASCRSPLGTNLDILL